MPVEYWILAESRLLYARASGEVRAEEVLAAGAQMFAEDGWRDGFAVLCDYRAVTKMSLEAGGIRKIVAQDRSNESVFGQSKCAVVAGEDVVFGVARMWEILGEDNAIETLVTRDIIEACGWLDVAPKLVEPGALDERQRRQVKSSA